MTTTQDTKRVALITGANKGIGFEIARQLGEHGITVLVGARDSARGQTAVERLRAESHDAQLLLLDVTDPTTILAAAQQIAQTYGKLDILVNNAGILIDHVPPSQLDVADLQRTLATNVVGVFAVTQALLPLLRHAPSGRIVNLSSVLASLSTTSNADSLWAQPAFNHLAYNASKTAINALTVQFAIELRGTTVKINAASPGYIATDLNNYQGPRTPAQGAATPVRLALLPDDGPSGGFFNDDGPVPW